MKLSYLLKKHQTSTASRQRPTLPQGISNHTLSWLTRATAIAYNFAKINKINYQHQHSRNYNHAMMETQNYLFLDYLFSQGSFTINLCPTCVQTVADKRLNHHRFRRAKK